VQAISSKQTSTTLISDMPPKKVSSPKKKLHDDALSPPKKSCFSVNELSALNPSDPRSDLYWDSPAGKGRSMYVQQMLDVNDAEAKSPKKTGHVKAAGAGSKAQAKTTFNRGAFSSAQPSMTETEQKEYYLKTYPFNYLTLQDFKATADSIERVYQIEMMTGIGKDEAKSRTMEALVLYCRFLEDESPLSLSKCVCVDLMSNGGEVALYGFAFDFERIIDINLTEASRARSKELIATIPGLKEKCSILTGTFRDYFPYDAQVYYMDCTWLCDGRTFVDEFVFIKAVFDLCARIEQAGSFAYLCLLTQTKELEPVRDFAAAHMKVLLRTVIHFGLPDECVAWVFQVLPKDDSDAK
jgi:hypothetical protein